MKTTPITPDTTPDPEVLTRAAWRAGVLGALNALFVILAVRAILLVAVVGAIWMAMIAVDRPDPYRLGALAIYCLATIVPTVWLAARR
jgi:hypothetical protein